VLGSGSGSQRPRFGALPYLAWADLAALVVVREAELQNRAEQSRAELRPRAWARALCGVGAGVVLLSAALRQKTVRVQRLSVSVSVTVTPFTPSAFQAPTDGLASVLVAKSTSETDHCVATGMPRPTPSCSNRTSLAPLRPCSLLPAWSAAQRQMVKQKSQNVRRRLLALLTNWGST
jgi:hypothetical protein